MIISAKIARYILIVFIIYVVSIIIPKYYGLSFYKSIQAPRLYFSPVSQKFLQTREVNRKFKRFDSRGNEISRKKFERLTPFFSYRQLLYRDELPDSVHGVPVDAHLIRDNNIFLWTRPSEIYHYQIQLFPLMESKPDGPNLSDPDEFFRITDRFSFINCESNKIETSLSNNFNNELVKNGFLFPAKSGFGNPTTRKPFDDGYFIIDSKDNLFHLKRVHNKPYCKKIDLPAGIRVKFIIVDEMELKEFHCVLFTKDNRVFLVLFDNYKLVELPLKGFDNSKMRFELWGNLLYRQINIVSDNQVSTFVTDRNYNLLKTYTAKWPTNEQAAVGKTFQYLFPFGLSLTNENNKFINFYSNYSSWHFIIGNIIALLAALIFFNIFNKRKKTTQIIDLIIIAVTGLYGLIAAVLIRDEN